MIRKILKRLKLKLIWNRFRVGEKRFLNKLKLEGKTVYDIGAYKGNLTKIFLKKVKGDGFVFCFEPNPRSYMMLKNTFKLDSRVKILNIALGRREQKERFFYSENLGALTSKYNPNLVQPVKIEELLSFECKLKKLDDLNFSPPPDLIKIDVEGMEFEVILGANKLIKRYKPNLILEIHHMSLEDSKQRKNMDWSLDLLKKLKYRLYWIEQKKYVAKFKMGHIYCSISREVD